MSGTQQCKQNKTYMKTQSWTENPQQKEGHCIITSIFLKSLNATTFHIYKGYFLAAMSGESKASYHTAFFPTQCHSSPVLLSSCSWFMFQVINTCQKHCLLLRKTIRILQHKTVLHQMSRLSPNRSATQD